MRIAVFTDIHGNEAHLRRVLELITREQPDRAFFLGDIFQRGDGALACLQLLMDSGITCLAGNCELYLDRGTVIDPDVAHLAPYYDGMRARLTPAQRDFVHSLPLSAALEADGHRLLLCHWLTEDPAAPYPFLPLAALGDGRLADRAAGLHQDLILLGHAHRSMAQGRMLLIPAAGLEERPRVLLLDTADIPGRRLAEA